VKKIMKKEESQNGKQNKKLNKDNEPDFSSPD
jgi:hypothetical protein